MLLSPVKETGGLAPECGGSSSQSGNGGSAPKRASLHAASWLPLGGRSVAKDQLGPSERSRARPLAGQQLLRLPALMRNQPLQE